MSSAWESTWTDLNNAFAQLAGELILELPHLRWDCGHSDNEAFPFRAFAGYSLPPWSDAPDDDVVISIDFKSVGGTVHYTSYICLSHGQIVAEGPEGQLREIHRSEEGRSLAEVTEALCDFVTSNRAIVMRGLTGRGQRPSD